MMVDTLESFTVIYSLLIVKHALTGIVARAHPFALILNQNSELGLPLGPCEFAHVVIKLQTVYR